MDAESVNTYEGEDRFWLLGELRVEENGPESKAVPRISQRVIEQRGLRGHMAYICFCSYVLLFFQIIQLLEFMIPSYCGEI